MRSFNFIPNYTVSSTVGITLLVSLVKMSLLSSQDSRFLGWRIFLKIRVFLRLLFFISSTSSFITATFSLIADTWFFNWSIWKSLFSILSVLFFSFDRLDLPILIALVAVISTFLTKSMSSSPWFLICSPTESKVFFQC